MTTLFTKTAEAALIKGLPSVPLLDKINATIINPLITLMFGGALVVFLWGVIDFIKNADDTKGREQGKQHIIWGLIGLAVMASVFGLMEVISSILQRV